MLISVTATEQSKLSIVESYDALGYSFSHDAYENGEYHLFFRGRLPTADVAAQLDVENINMFLEFADGEVSPLFIRKERDFSE